MPRQFKVLLILVAALAALLHAYGPSLDGEVLWDDDGHLTKPALLEDGGLAKIWFEPGETQQYYPLLHTAFRIQHAVFENEPYGYRVVNLVFHAFNALLLALVLRALKIRGADLAACLFLLHPVAVESVAWISELKNLLSGFFFLMALWVWVRFDRLDEDDAPTKRCPGLWTASLVFFIAAILSKSVTATWPGVVLVLTWWRRGELSLRRDFLALLPHFVCGIAMGAMTVWVERDLIGAKGEEFALGFFARFELAARVPWFYLGKDLWPAPQMFIYPRWELGGAGMLAILPTVGALAAAFYIRKTVGRWPLAALLLFGGLLFPVLGFFNVYPFRFAFVADHFQYLARAIVLVVATVGLIRLVDHFQIGVAGRWIGAVLLCACLAGLSRNHASNFMSDETLWKQTIAENPEAYMAYDNLAIYLQAERPLESVDILQRLIAKRPREAKTRVNLGNTYVTLGRIDAAVLELEKATTLGPKLVEAWASYGQALYLAKRFDEAIAACEKALEINAEFSPAARNLGAAWVGKGDLDQAEKATRRALEIDNRSAGAWFNLGSIMMSRQKLDEAEDAYRKATELQPDYFEAQRDHAQLLRIRGKREAARDALLAAVKEMPDNPTLWYMIAQVRTELTEVREAAIAWRKLLAMNRDQPDALAGLAWIYATGPDADLIDGGEALALAERARQVMDGQAFFHDAHGAALARTRRFGEAVVAARKAHALLIKAGATDYAARVAGRIALYEKGEPYTATKN